jgi:hypothetical protein
LWRFVFILGYAAQPRKWDDMATDSRAGQAPWLPFDKILTRVRKYVKHFFHLFLSFFRGLRDGLAQAFQALSFGGFRNVPGKGTSIAESSF